ncbi:MAG: 16S rRNA (cytosine(1402)-N(4))-methyltransferase RsmH [Thermodesulfobacteriota bacterium]
MEFYHRPVMPVEVDRFLECKAGGTYVDGTLGGGGHAEAILAASAPDGRLIGIDWDEEALLYARERLKPYAGRVEFVKGNFANIKGILRSLEVDKVDGILLDLGVSSRHLEKPERGFSFQYDAPLDMRMDREGATTACDLVNGLPQEELRELLKKYGDERWAKRIAMIIVRTRQESPIRTTKELADIVSFAIPRKHHPRSRHPATKTFLALRIAVNREIENLEAALHDGIGLLYHGGRMVVITFHSLEDRIVKNAFRQFTGGCVCPSDTPYCVCKRRSEVRILTRKALTPSQEEIEGNPRARSAKLRAVVKI